MAPVVPAAMPGPARSPAAAPRTPMGTVPAGPPAPTRGASPAPAVPPASGVGRLDGQGANQQHRRECAGNEFHGVTFSVCRNEILGIRNRPVSSFPSTPKNFAYRGSPKRKTGGAKASRRRRSGHSSYRSGLNGPVLKVSSPNGPSGGGATDRPNPSDGSSGHPMAYPSRQPAQELRSRRRAT